MEDLSPPAIRWACSASRQPFLSAEHSGSQNWGEGSQSLFLTPASCLLPGASFPRSLQGSVNQVFLRHKLWTLGKGRRTASWRRRSRPAPAGRTAREGLAAVLTEVPGAPDRAVAASETGQPRQPHPPQQSPALSLLQMGQFALALSHPRAWKHHDSKN